MFLKHLKDTAYTVWKKMDFPLKVTGLCDLYDKARKLLKKCGVALPWLGFEWGGKLLCHVRLLWMSYDSWQVILIIILILISVIMSIVLIWVAKALKNIQYSKPNLYSLKNTLIDSQCNVEKSTLPYDIGV